MGLAVVGFAAVVAVLVVLAVDTLVDRMGRPLEVQKEARILITDEVVHLS